MQTGKLVEASSVEWHLGDDLWIQVYPQRATAVEDVKLLCSIPRGDRTFSMTEIHAPGVQSPILVREKAWNRIMKGQKPITRTARQKVAA